MDSDPDVLLDYSKNEFAFSNTCGLFLLYGRFHWTTGVSLAYLRTPISSRVFNQIVGFSGEIVVLHGNATSELSATITKTETRKEAKKKTA